MEEAPWDEVEQLEAPPDKDWPTLEEEEALREVEYDLAQDLEAHGEEMSYRPTSDEGEDLEMGEPEEDERQGEGDGDRLEPLPVSAASENSGGSRRAPEGLRDDHDVYLPTTSLEERSGSPCWNAGTVWNAETPRLPCG